MERSTEYYSAPTELAIPAGKNEAFSSAVSWAAVIAGAFVAAALSLIMLALGTGIGLSSMSPWSNEGVASSTAGSIAIVWLIVTQIIASTMGGYLAGRLRTKWVNIHSHEVYFRDTAHGFLVWAVSLVVTASFLITAATAMVGGVSRIGTAAAQSEGQRVDPNDYFVDTLLRSDRPIPDQNGNPIRSEVRSIFAMALRQGDISAPDKTYLGGIVASKTGLGQTEAERRVSEVFAQNQQAADTARKAIAHSLYWTFLALLIGAFCASFSATIGGKKRDQVVTV